MHPYFDFIIENETGALVESQIKLLKKIIKARALVGWLMVICFAFLAILTILAFGLDESTPPFLWVFVIAYIAGFVWGIFLLKEQRKNKKKFTKLSVNHIQAKPKKIGRAVAIPTPIGSLGPFIVLMHMRHGLIKLGKNKYGALPGIYPVVEDGKEANFYYVDMKFGGIKGVVVNYDK